MNRHAPVAIRKDERLPFPVLPPEGSQDPDRDGYFSMIASSAPRHNRGYADEPETVVIDGYGIAESMIRAEAEDEYRTKAARNRQVNRAPQELVDLSDSLADINSQLRHTKPLVRRLRPKKQKRLQAEAERLEEAQALAGLEAREARLGAIVRTQAEFLEDFSPMPRVSHALTDRNSMGRAGAYDFSASRIGDWAVALHDHPLSEAFRAAHPGVDVTPKTLDRMQSEEELISRRIAGYETPKGVNEDEVVMEALRARLGEIRVVLADVRREVGVAADQ